MKNYNYLLLIIAFILQSCEVQTTIVDTSCQKYKSDSFSKAMITQKGIGILPVLGADEQLSLRRITGEALDRNMKLAYGNTPVKATTEVLSKMYETNLSEEYHAAVIKYASTDSLSKNMLEQLGQSLSVNYILTSRLWKDEEYENLNKKIPNKENIPIDEMFLQSQVWDTKTGLVVWEGMGGVAVLKSKQINLVESTAANLSKVIAKEKVYDSYNASYVRYPCQTKEQVYNYRKNIQLNQLIKIIMVILGVNLFFHLMKNNFFFRR